ncbi:MAG: PEP-CTERM sorting domain-containing protein [Bryobacterales bacterium]|nr:PEP-CTERM sorting domain-containing protein [Bryobacterales bacterium]
MITPPGVPEPSTYALMGTGVLALLALRRRKAAC